MAAIGKECDEEVGEALFGETDKEEEDNAEAVPRHHDHEEVGTPVGAACSKESSAQ